MKLTHRPRTSSLFLLELIFSILFFSVASAVCVQIFVRAHTLSRDARALHAAVSVCSDAAEIGSNADAAADAAEKLAALYPDAAIESPALDGSSLSSVTVGFDAELQLCAADTVYLLTADYYEADAMLHCKAVMTKTGSSEEIYRLETVHYLPGGNADE